ncbi:hypothetical protein [Kytococcus schroeteri]|uniref:hypothetical protein n=1 Tax=Kytococcus schroeteri TaxID=138300 RepID=UPI001144F927|nr:hypothetical protein [Kytococcus schroeteri]
MPTTRPRHLVTESDELGQALDHAARRWPELSRGQLVARLAVEGGRRLAVDEGVEAERRRRLLEVAGGHLAGVGDSSRLRTQRDAEWPE